MPILTLKRSFLGPNPALTIISQNIEGFSASKGQLLATLCAENNCDILCIQETHRDMASTRPKIQGMILIGEIPNKQYGSAIFSKPGLIIENVEHSNTGNIEIITIEVKGCTVTSIYKPPNINFDFEKPKNFDNNPVKIVIGDFNSHSCSWGYLDTDLNGEKVEEWAEAQLLSLIHDPKLPKSFNSGRWKKGYNPDLIFVSNNISQQCVKNVCNPIPKTQHTAIKLQIFEVIRGESVPFKRRFNYKKANWEKYGLAIDSEIQNLEPTPGNYDHFVKIVNKISRQHIPRGCRQN